MTKLCVTKLCVCDKVVFERDGPACSVDATKCHACLAKRRSMPPSARPVCDKVVCVCVKDCV